ncbi:hypothetical protein AC792_09965 [Arthrobacter sp. RIT-PI-e]|uniref:NAD-dependent epimerase/dehydratase family protein n=1 Tax=Arthrobacter sp. RIT-PI-e TaxID=1681197 RepID=UPI000676140E|nr:NAD-dependent epimerase/dehydratase family protein [Arthrobacter sp. RIT-PI-e]KNC18828.1 hypothetical protein AC792_09965 [Arthrobacter sp. RIT-PI-e]
MTWVVLGGSGFVGSAVLTALREAGIGGRAVPASRLGTSAGTPADLVEEASRVDITELSGLLEGADVVVNAAGLATPSAGDGPELAGATALLPAVVLRAAAAVGVHRLVHVSSAAVQGRTALLDESSAVSPFSAYSRSKALGEQALARAAGAASDVSVVTVRATSVQGAGRPTTAALARLARSPLASVAAPGDAASPVTSVTALAELVLSVGRHDGELPRIVLQPWEGLSVRSVLEAAGGRPRVLPSSLCRLAPRAGSAAAQVLRGRPGRHGRRVGLTWFGQEQVPGWAVAHDAVPAPRVRAVLAGAGAEGTRSTPAG